MNDLAHPFPTTTYTRRQARQIADSRKATGFVVTCEGKWQMQGPYYAQEKHAQAEADWLTRRFGKDYGVEAVSTAECGLRHTSRIPELEAGAKAQRDARQRAALITRLVKRGVPYGDAIRAAQTRFPFERSNRA